MSPLMSLMVPDLRPVGYSVTRKKAESGFDRERLPRFDEIPERKLGLVPLMAKFAFGDKSIAVFTEGSRCEPFAGADCPFSSKLEGDFVFRCPQPRIAP